MEVWQIDHIRKHLPDLLRMTKCSVLFLSHFRADGLISEEEVDILCNVRNIREQAMSFYNIIQTRCKSFNLLKQALTETSQTGAFAILEKCPQEEKAKLQYHGAIGYDKTEVLGRGCFGTKVFLGKYGSRDVAVKKINTDEVAAEIAKQEVIFLKKLDWHENVVRLFEMVETEDFILIALELCDTDLHDWVLSPKRNIVIGEVEVITQSARGIGHLHKNRVVHRDLKPANILMVRQATGDIRVKISDFGMAKKIPDGKSRMTLHSSGVGTEGWTAPEIMAYQQGRPCGSVVKMGFPSDIFSLGCIFYFVLTKGVHPFGDQFVRQGKIMKGKSKLEEEQIKLLQVDTSGFVMLIKEMIAKEEEARPQISEVIDCLAELNKKEILAEGRERGEMEGASQSQSPPTVNELNKDLATNCKLELDLNADDRTGNSLLSEPVNEQILHVPEEWISSAQTPQSIKEHDARQHDINKYDAAVSQLGKTATARLLQEEHPTLEQTLNMLEKEVNHFQQWVAERKAVASVEELGQDYNHASTLLEDFKEFARDTESIGFEKISSINVMIDAIIASKHSHSQTPVIYEWRRGLNNSYADLLELIDTRTQMLAASKDLHEFFGDCKYVLNRISVMEVRFLNEVSTDVEPSSADPQSNLTHNQLKQDLIILQSQVEKVQEDSKKLQLFYTGVKTSKDELASREEAVVNGWMTLQRLNLNKLPNEFAHLKWKGPWTTTNEKTLEGSLSRKQEWQSTNKMAANRSWGKIYVAVQRQHLLFCRDPIKYKIQNEEYYLPAEDPVHLAGAWVEAAADYAKKRYVFRLKLSTGAQYLFQAKDDDELNRWVGGIRDAIQKAGSVAGPSQYS